MNLTLLPSLSYFSIYILKAISNHPLIVNPIISDPLTDELVPISKYRLRSGLYIGTGLACSIYPYGVKEINPTVANSVIYKPYNLGASIVEAIHHLIVEYSINAVNYDGTNAVEDPLLISAPSKSALNREEEILFTNSPSSSISLEINPSTFILSDYLELTRLILNDVSPNTNLTISNDAPPIRNLEVVSANIDPIAWDKQKEIYFHSGKLLIRFESYLSNDWKGKFNVNINEFQLDTSLMLC